MKNIYKILYFRLPNENFRKEIPGVFDIYSEENFIDFVVFSKKIFCRLHTYRENAKGISYFKNPNAIVFYIHGFFGHQNRCAHVAKYFAEYGITTVGNDSRGHGKSQGLPVI